MLFGKPHECKPRKCYKKGGPDPLHWNKLLRSLQSLSMNAEEMREPVTSRWFPTLGGIKVLPPSGEVRVDFDDLRGNFFRWVRAIFQSVGF